MFSREFYPTPKAVIEMMTAGIEIKGKVFLEPSAGKGDIVDYLVQNGAKQVIASELHKELRMILENKCQVIGSDFFQVTEEQVSHVDYIIMNPPFSNASKHIQHAWNIAPGGCQVIALCNIETVKNRYSSSRTTLGEIIDKNGYHQNIGNMFSDSERETDVEVALVNLFKPKAGDSEFDSYFFDMNEDQEEAVQNSGIMQHNDVREVVNRYVAGVKMFDSVMEANKAINSMIRPISTGLDISFGASNTRERYSSEITRDIFKKELQKSAWRSIFNKMNMSKYVTRGVLADINKFVEQQQQIPFTMSNIYKMIEIIFGTHAGRMDKVLVEAFDRICSLSADNSEAGEKWKTNSNYKINRRFIDTWICDYDKRWPTSVVKIRHGGHSDTLDDIIKALCFLTGKKYDDVMHMEYPSGYGNSRNTCNKTLYNFFSYSKTPWGEWVQWNDFFRVRGYKKGTMHFEFIDEKVWLEFNKRVGKIKGWVLPQKTDEKTKGTERSKTNKMNIYV